jgi:hypothetical protein
LKGREHAGNSQLRRHPIESSRAALPSAREAFGQAVGREFSQRAADSGGGEADQARQIQGPHWFASELLED